MAQARKKRLRAPQMQPEERKQQLLRAGVACIANKGIGGTKHADLARTCGVSVPTIFTYFPNRESLVTSILDEVGEKLLAQLLAPADPQQSAQERLAANAKIFIDFATEDPDYVKVWLMWSMHFAPELQERYRIYEKRLIKALAAMIKDSPELGKSDEQDILDRAQIISASSAFLAKLVFDGVSETRRDVFVEHIIHSLVHE